VYVAADLATCEARDVKGLYKRARSGEIAEFTGISAPYEAPDAPELTLDTADWSIERCVDELVAYVERASGLRDGNRTQRL
jgi:adenylylsulfate kinase-like enzyme